MMQIVKLFYVEMNNLVRFEVLSDILVNKLRVCVTARKQKRRVVVGVHAVFLY
jgi:hypothetical protein